MRAPSPPLPLGPADGRLTAREWTALVLGALAVRVGLCFVDPSLFGSADWVRMHSLYNAYIQSAVAQGRLPLWNPHHWLGRPFLADDEATALMRAGHDFHGTAWVEQPLDLPSHSPAPPARATITRFEPERISVAVESTTPGLLVLAEPWFPGWSARANGRPAPRLPANAWTRAVSVPADGSEVILTFRSTYLTRGAAISLAALAVIVALLARRRWTVRRELFRARPV